MTDPMCCTVDDLLTRSGLAGGSGARQARLPQPVRAVHQKVLAHFARHGRAPAAADLAAAAGEVGLDVVHALRVLAEADLVHTDADSGAVTVAYPFSGVPTAHRVRLSTGVQVWAMCAIDALGIPAMLGTDAQVSSVDPLTGDPVEVIVDAAGAHPTPTGAVVVLPTGVVAGRCVDCICPRITFHTDADTAGRWQRGQGVTGMVLSIGDAAAAGVAVFGGLLSRTPVTG